MDIPLQTGEREEGKEAKPQLNPTFHPPPQKEVLNGE